MNVCQGNPFPVFMRIAGIYGQALISKELDAKNITEEGLTIPASTVMWRPGEME